MNWKNHPFDICLNLLTTIKEGWCVRLGQEGGFQKGGWGLPV